MTEGAENKLQRTNCYHCDEVVQYRESSLEEHVDYDSGDREVYWYVRCSNSQCGEKVFIR